eukprot:TRINITY_DN10207_c0_g1_i1.p1 TRINITY_DN10207_c0_g1~~TRINITY_DN10207_c0_g1_i1.p1  ORF type:complete len:380 (-),score=101.46 TRINITY_DN10207_c0_g1_i1:73-1050(-)
MLGVSSVCPQNSNYGITKISALDPSNTDFVPLHTKPIRDMKFDPNGKGLLLTTSLDKTAKISCPRTKNIVVNFGLDTASMACEWDHTDPYIIYLGQNDSLRAYDIRKHSVPLRKIYSVGKQQGLHSLHYVSQPQLNTVTESSQHTPASSVPLKGLCAASVDTILFYDGNNNWSSYKVQMNGFCTSLSYDPISHYLMSSFRNSESSDKPSHTIYRQTSPITQRELRTLYVSDIVKTDSITPLARSNIFTLSTSHSPNPSPTPTRAIAATADQNTHQVVLWDVTLGSPVQKLPAHSSHLLDMRHFGDGTMDFLASLSEKQLFVYKLI